MTATLTRSATKLDFDVKIPAQLLWAAAQCASSDQYKGALHTVQVQLDCAEHNKIKVTIRATNGHIAYRVVSYCEGEADNLPESFCVDAKTLAKILKTENHITLTRIAGELRVQGFKMGIRIDAEYLGGHTYPNVDAIWPDIKEYGNIPGAPIGIAGTYLELVGKIANRVTEKGNLRMHSAALPTTPVIFTTGTDADCPEMLVMPVQFRA